MCVPPEESNYTNAIEQSPEPVRILQLIFNLFCLLYQLLFFKVGDGRLLSQIPSNKLLNWDTLVSPYRNLFGLIDL